MSFKTFLAVALYASWTGTSSAGVDVVPGSHTAQHRTILKKLLFASAVDDAYASTECVPWAVPEADRCSYVRSHLDICEGSAMIPYLEWYYCYIRWPILGNLLLCIWLAFLLLVLTVVADRFFCPALEVISDFLQLSENVAGATLLSFGNGAPDLFTQLAAVETMDASSVPMALGEPMGGGLFVSNIVLAMVVFFGGAGASRTVVIEKRAFLRDAGFYTGAVGLLMLIGWDGKLTLMDSLGLLLYYGLFVAFIVIFDRKKSDPMHIEESHRFQQALNRFQDGMPIASRSTPGNYIGAPRSREGSGLSEVRVPVHTASASVGHAVLNANASTARDTILPLVHPARSNKGEGGGGAARTPPTSPRRMGENANDRRKRVLLATASDRSPALEVAVEALSDVDDASTSVDEPLLSPRSTIGPVASAHSGEEEEEDEDVEAQGEEERTWKDALKLPVVCLLRLTMPEVGMDDNVSYPKLFAVLLPVTAPLFVVLAQGMALQRHAPLGVDAIVYGASCSLFSSAVIYAIYPSSGRHYGILSGLFTVMTFCMSILWMDVAAAAMVHACKCMGYIHGLNQAMLGVTVLAWANSFGDLVADVSMAKDGFPAMAVAATFASPLFTMTAGLGLSFTIAIMQHGPLEFVPNAPFRTAIMFSVASILRHLVLVPSVLRWKLTRFTAVSMIMFYLIFQLVYVWQIARYS